jgi:hypothetical protein
MNIDRRGTFGGIGAVAGLSLLGSVSAGTDNGRGTEHVAHDTQPDVSTKHHGRETTGSYLETTSNHLETTSNGRDEGGGGQDTTGGGHDTPGSSLKSLHDGGHETMGWGHVTLQDGAGGDETTRSHQAVGDDVALGGCHLQCNGT